MRLLPLSLLLASAFVLTGCTGASTAQDAPGTLAEVAAALRAAIVEAADEETADALDDENGVLDQVAFDLVAMCKGEDPIGMGIVMLANYGMDEIIAEGWDVACPGKTFPG